MQQTSQDLGARRALGRREFLERSLRLAAVVGLSRYVGACTGLMPPTAPSGSAEVPDEPPIIRPGETLRSAARSSGLLFGTATQWRYSGASAVDPIYRDAIAAECELLVAEGELKWKSIRPSPGEYDFRWQDIISDFAEAQGMLVRGHTLVWHYALPDWFPSIVTPENARQHLVEHITTVAGHYRGRMHSWDVVNEPIDLDSGHPDGLRTEPWLRLLPDYIEVAFRTAHEADPHGMLVLNEHTLERDGADAEARRRAMIRLLDRLLSRGVPVHALGLQGHVSTRDTFTRLPSFLSDVKSMGLKVLVTELDVIEHDVGSLAERDRAVADTYRRLLDIVLADPALCVAVVTWGLSDRYSWLHRYAPRPDGLPLRPLPLDETMQRKTTWEELALALLAAPTRNWARSERPDPEARSERHASIAAR